MTTITVAAGNDWEDSKPITFNEWLNNEQLSDAFINVDNRLIPVNRVILALKSQVFKEMFFKKKEDNNEEVVTIHLGGNYKVVEAFIHFIYTDMYYMNEVVDGGKDILRLLEMADQYKVQGLRLKVAQALSNLLLVPGYLSYSNFFDVHQLATGLGSEHELGRKILNRIAKWGRDHQMKILAEELSQYYSVQRVKQVINVLAANQSLIIKVMDRGLIASSGRSHNDFETLIELSRCSLQELFKLNELKLFSINNLSELILQRLDQISALISPIN